MVAAVALAVKSGRLCSTEGDGEVAIPQMLPAGEPIALSDKTFEELVLHQCSISAYGSAD
jgi:hypothetical protein